jgi:hypothetical protein
VFAALTYLALAASPDDVSITQARLDQLLHSCAAEKVVRLTALSPNEVAIEILNLERAPASSENRQLTCVLRGTKKMADLRFGFFGNAFAPGDH